MFLSLEGHLKALRLPTFLKEYKTVARESVQKNASYEDFLQFLSEKEVISKQTKATQNRLKKAAFPVLKTLTVIFFPEVHPENVPLNENLSNATIVVLNVTGIAFE